MRWSKRVFAFVRASALFLGISVSASCSIRNHDYGFADDAPLGPDPNPTCPGICVHTPPATFTGPSLFWIGLPKLVPECPPATPYQGIEGFVQSPMLMELARECRITPTDTCATEGLTCSPLPPDDYHVCIHHDDDRPCPSVYPEHRTIIDDESAATVTLCCMESLAPT